MRRFSKLTRAVLIPVAALTILVGSAMPASADTGSAGTVLTKVVTVVPAVAKPIVRTLSINW
jgi:hypothetical protein